MKKKVSELEGAELDTLVAKAENVFVINVEGRLKTGHPEPFNLIHSMDYCPSGDWSQGGPIIEREKIAIVYNYGWEAYHEGSPSGPDDQLESDTNSVGFGETPLISAMRCYVLSKFGKEVDI